MLPSWEHVPVQVMPDDHSKSVPPLPIPNRTVKRFYADDSAATSVKVGYCQASYKRKTPQKCGVFFRLELVVCRVTPAWQCGLERLNRAERIVEAGINA